MLSNMIMSAFARASFTWSKVSVSTSIVILRHLVPNTSDRRHDTTSCGNVVVLYHHGIILAPCGDLSPLPGSGVLF